MEIGAFFILVLFVIVLGAIGGGVYLIAAKRRRRELSTAPEGKEDAAQGGRPAHLTVENDQQTDFVGSR